MKTFTRVILLSVGLASAAFPFAVVAAENTVPTPAPATTGRHLHPRLRAKLQRRMAATRHVARRLSLSNDQVAQLKALRAQTRSTVKGLRADSSLTLDQKKAKARETLQAARTQMRGTMTPDQQARLKQMRKRLRAFRDGTL